MTVVNKFDVNREQVTLDPDIIENMSANDVAYDDSFQYDENTVGGKLSELEYYAGVQSDLNIKFTDNLSSVCTISVVAHKKDFITFVNDYITSCGGYIEDLMF